MIPFIAYFFTGFMSLTLQVYEKPIENIKQIIHNKNFTETQQRHERQLS